MTLEKITVGHPLIPYVTLYDKQTMKELVHPCFSETVIILECRHTISVFFGKWTDPSYCDECKAARKVIKNEFRGAHHDEIDYDRPESVYLGNFLKEWDVESKTGLYVQAKTKRMPNGKHIARYDSWNAPNYGGFSDEELEAKQDKYAEQAIGRYSDNRCITVFHFMDYALNVPEQVAALKRYLEHPEVKAFITHEVGRRGNGFPIVEVGKELFNKDLKVPEPKVI